MPRTGRGGPRVGQPGKAYPNRSDLRAQPVRTAPGQVYGQAAAQAEAQKALPLSQLAPPPSPNPAPAPSPVLAPPLTDPTQRPAEPVTAGLPVGPGPGPEVLNLSTMGAGLARTLANYAEQSADPSLLLLAERARSLGM